MDNPNMSSFLHMFVGDGSNDVGDEMDVLDGEEQCLIVVSTEAGVRCGELDGGQPWVAALGEGDADASHSKHSGMCGHAVVRAAEEISGRVGGAR
uniref:Uncharacterized protein n=1 Tax=Oryza glumipatula TaxID=40148 RepID=A0A0E0BGF9_9ORYZ